MSERIANEYNLKSFILIGITTAGEVVDIRHDVTDDVIIDMCDYLKYKALSRATDKIIREWACNHE